MANSRSKGKGGEQELAKLLREEMGFDVKRNLNQTRDSGHDLLGLEPFAVEVKREKEIRLPAWWRQAVAQAEAAGMQPALAYRMDRKGWRVRIPMAAMIGGLGPVDDLEWTADISLAAFCVVVRERQA